MMKLSVQGVEAVKGQPDFLAGKDIVYMQTLPLRCLSFFHSSGPGQLQKEEPSLCA